MSDSISITPITPEHTSQITTLLTKNWGGVELFSRGGKVDASALPGFIAVGESKNILGLITLHFTGEECEIVTLDALVKRRGIGKSLLEAAISYVKSRNIKKLWLITSNDNIDALAFYQKAGLRLTKIYPDAITESRKLKPQIPLVAENGIPIRDEIELEMAL